MSSSSAAAGGRDSLPRRVSSAVVGIPVLLLFIWAGGYPFTVLVGLAALLGLLEFYRLSEVLSLWLQRFPGMVVTALLVAAGYQTANWMVLLVLFGLLALLAAHRGRVRSSARPWLLSLAGPLYLGATLSYAVALRGLVQGREWVLLAMLATFSVDTFAYFVGKAIGRHRMAPRVSPGKTWEGAVAGLAAGVAATVLLDTVLSLPLETWEAAILGTGIGVVAQAGDLLESALKRAAKAKEAGWLIPGHGGILDRLDSIVFVLVLVYHGFRWAAT
ncbi:MAG: phosphatidate cytidylyltransferase [Dehalococcoidia bacterium]|nr:phosphatidate cytidylyltransferase [Dehalococcoidia bacterium]